MKTAKPSALHILSLGYLYEAMTQNPGPEKYCLCPCDKCAAGKSHCCQTWRGCHQC